MKLFEKYRITVDMLNPCKDLDQGSAAKEVIAPNEKRAIWLVAHHYFTEFPKLEFITIKYVLHYRKEIAGWNGLSDRFYYSGERLQRKEIFNHQANKAPLRNKNAVCPRCGYLPQSCYCMKGK